MKTIYKASGFSVLEDINRLCVVHGQSVFWLANPSSDLYQALKRYIEQNEHKTISKMIQMIVNNKHIYRMTIDNHITI